MKKWTLPSKLHRYVYKKDIDKALGFLSKITAINETGLFKENDEGYLRFAGAFRVQLLMELGITVRLWHGPAWKRNYIPIMCGLLFLKKALKIK